MLSIMKIIMIYQVMNNMEDKIKIYELLLNEKTFLEKECFHYEVDYFREFGEKIENLFQLKVDSITLKKKIAFCVKKTYNNKPIYSYDLDRYIDEEIIEYQQRLQELIDYNKYIKEDERTPITFDESHKIKKLYYKVAHLVHPDLHPEYKEDEDILELWNKAVNAYKSNNLKLLVEAYDQIIILVNDNDIYIEDIENKIETLKEEINEIKNNTPYTYKFILNDVLQVEELHNDLDREIKDYQEYKSSLENELSKFDIQVLEEA